MIVCDFKSDVCSRHIFVIAGANENICGSRKLYQERGGGENFVLVDNAFHRWPYGHQLDTIKLCNCF